MDPLASAQIPVSVNPEGSNPSNKTGTNHSAQIGTSSSTPTRAAPTGAPQTEYEPDLVDLNTDAPADAPASTYQTTDASAPTGQAPGSNISTTRTRSGNSNPNTDSSIEGSPYTWVRP